MDNYIHRIERIRRVCQPGHTASYERVMSARLHLAHSKEQAGKSLPARVVSFSVSLNAHEAADFALFRKTGGLFFATDVIRCRGPPQHLDFFKKFR